MALTESSAIRRDDSAGKAIKTFLDGDGDHIQAVALVDESGDQTGIAGNSQHITEDNSAALLTELQLKADLTETQPISFTNESGVAYGVKHIENQPRVINKSYLYAIAEGLVPNNEVLRKFGLNQNVSTSWETVCGTSALANYLIAEERIQISSDDANDNGAGGNGARTVLVIGLDGNYDSLSETVTMNGLANVLTNASFLRVFCLSVITAGTTGSNEGTITASNNADTLVLNQIEPIENQCLCAAYTVPNSYKFHLSQVMATEASTKGSQIALWHRPFGGLWAIAWTIVLLDSGIIASIPLPLLVPTKTDIEVRAKAIVDGAIVTVGFEGWIEEI